ncbi:hypothetical protein [Streptomyces sp. NBC_01462]|uniref:hypothetical protein n=1 Tax=Streptomyces sp. NBC_01462 TaxID=2903876 RepID=UPI002E375CFB|nr:hypothetical protein [Streptomyces sp. NBC_01462]
MLVAAALTSALLGAPESGAAQFDSGTAGAAGALGKARTGTLVTGDRVALDATGQVTGVRPAKGREGTTFRYAGRTPTGPTSSRVTPSASSRTAPPTGGRSAHLQYSLFERDVEQLFPVLEELGIGFVAFSPLGRRGQARRPVRRLPAPAAPEDRGERRCLPHRRQSAKCP